ALLKLRIQQSCLNVTFLSAILTTRYLLWNRYSLNIDLCVFVVTFFNRTRTTDGSGTRQLHLLNATRVLQLLVNLIHFLGHSIELFLLIIVLATTFLGDKLLNLGEAS